MLCLTQSLLGNTVWKPGAALFEEVVGEDPARKTNRVTGVLFQLCQWRAPYILILRIRAIVMAPRQHGLALADMQRARAKSECLYELHKHLQKALWVMNIISWRDLRVHIGFAMCGFRKPQIMPCHLDFLVFHIKVYIVSNFLLHRTLGIPEEMY